MTDGRERTEILALVARIRRRWRLRVALQGSAQALAFSLAVLFLSSLVLERARFAPEAVIWLRALVWGTLALSTVVFVIRPLLRKVTERQVALYLEEHEPTLEHAVVSALEATTDTAASPALSARLARSALDQARRLRNGRRVEQAGLYRFGGLLTAVAVAAVAFTLLGPAHLRTGLSALLFPLRDAASVNPYAVGVLPGDVTIARGTDQLVTAHLSGFESSDASIFTRTGPDAPFQRLSMIQADDGSFEVLLLGVADRTEYFVESNGTRSSTFTIDVADLPYVDRLDLTYHFPAYTGLPPRTIEDGGDVAALPGTVVEVRITPTLPSPGGRLVMDGQAGGDLTAESDGTLVGSFTVAERGFYAVELARDMGTLVPASPEYTIDLLTDQEPSIRFTKPGRDTPASPIEEVYLEVRADDDYGVGDLRIVYSVNGGPEDTLSVFEARGAPMPQVSTGHTLFLEEWELEPGDLVSYYALVRDNRGRSGGKPVSTDMYFLNIRPFERAYRQGEQQGGQPQGGQGGTAETALSELQRQIIAATFNLVRQQDSYASGEFSENVVSVSLSQGRLKEQVATLLERMQNRGLVESDAGFRDVSAILPKAAAAMDSAKAELDQERLQNAIPHEQTALRYLQQAEETYERYVVEQQSQQAGGGGGGEQSAAAEDLADLFELELDKLKNQYETVRRGEQQSADDQVDEVLEKLKELARRQEQEAERQRRRAQQAGQGAPQGGGQAQRDLAEEAEEAARELQRLARETGDAQLEEAARRLQDAAQSMRNSASRNGNAASSEASAAQQRLEEARRRLEQAQEDRARRDAEQALRQVDELSRQQRDVQRDVRDLPGSGQERAQEIERLRERKDQMTEAVANLERELDRAASVARAEQPEAARELQEAADQIRESKLKEKLQFSRGTIEQWDPQQATTLEMNIEADLQTLRDQLEEAAGAAGERQEDPLEQALEQTRDLVRGMEAMDRRLRESQAGDQGQPGQQPGQPGQQAGQQAGRQGGTPTGDPQGGGATRGDPRQRLSAEDVRQMRREFTERTGQLGEVQDRLAEAGRNAEELGAVLEAMQRLQREGIYDNPAQVAALQEEILQSLKRLEFGLRREVEGATDRRAALTGSDDVPDAYRKLVEEYYRKLAGGGGRDPGR